MSFHVLCSQEWVHCCVCLARVYVWLAGPGCWSVGLGGGRVMRFCFGGEDFGSG